MRDILDLHTHTIASGHAYNTINEMVHAAAKKGLQALGITEHAPAMPGSCHQMYFQNLRALRRKKEGIYLFFGAELNILDSDGKMDLPAHILEELDVGIASLHMPCMKPGSCEENTNAYIQAMKEPHVNIIGHPDDGRYAVDYLALVQAAKEHHVLLELNNSSLNPNGFRPDTRENDETMLRYCMQYDVPIILGSDAHVEEDVAEFSRARLLLEEICFPEELVVNDSLEKLLPYLPYAKLDD